MTSLDGDGDTAERIWQSSSGQRIKLPLPPTTAPLLENEINRKKKKKKNKKLDKTTVVVVVVVTRFGGGGNLFFIYFNTHKINVRGRQAGGCLLKYYIL